jgi:hypothetical protein
VGRNFEVRSYFTTDGQSVSMSWYRARLWNLRPDITSCRNVAVWNLRSCFCGAPSQTRERVYIEVTLRLTVSQSVCLGIEHTCGTYDQMLLPVGMLLSEICGIVSVGRPLWREDGSAICSVITHCSEFRRTRSHTLLYSPETLFYLMFPLLISVRGWVNPRA